MHAEVIREPELEFGGGGPPHRSRGSGSPTTARPTSLLADAPRAIRVGLIGPADQLPGLRAWFERCREPIAAKDERYPHLFPGVPRLRHRPRPAHHLVFSDRNTRAISDRDLRAIAARQPRAALQTAVRLYAAEITALADENRVDVLLVARPSSSSN